MNSQLALHHYARGVATVSECAIPELASDEVLIKVAAVALNPIDWKILHGEKSSAPSILGCDLAGTVTCVGDGVTAIEVGARVIAFVAGGNALRPRDGAFAQYVAASAHLTLHLPHNVSFESGATLPTPLFVGGFSLYRHLSLPYPPLPDGMTAHQPMARDGSEHKAILIYGGGTATGSMQIQLAKLSGLKVYTVCSQDSFKLVKECGAHHVSFYDEPSTLTLLRSATQGKIQVAVDCISSEQSAAICATNMEISGGKYISFTAQGEVHDSRITVVKLFGFTMMNREFLFESKGIRAEINREDVNFATEFAQFAEQLLAVSAIKYGPAEVRPGGFNGIISGLEELKSGKVRRKRLVYLIQ